MNKYLRTTRITEILKNIPSTWLKLSLLFLVVSSTTLFPQTKKVNYKILAIEVKGNVSADAPTIIANSGLKVGEEISVPGDLTIKAIKQLWSLNIFSDIKLIIEKKIGNGIFLLIKVKEYPRFEKVLLEGNDEISTDKLMGKINFVRGQILKPEEVFNARNDILSLYDKEGYLNASVTPLEFTYLSADTVSDKIITRWRNKKDFSLERKLSYDYNPKSRRNIIKEIKNRILLVYKIKEGQKVKVEHIVFRGNKAFSQSKLKGELDHTEEAKWWKFWSSADFNRKDFKEDLKGLRKFYLKNGYRDFEVLSDSLMYTKNKKGVTILINIYEGPQYKIRNITWDGNTIYSDKVLNSRLGFHKGDIFNYEKFNRNLHFNKQQDDVSSLYQDNGFLAFKINAEEQKVASDSIDIHIHIRENKRFKIGKVTIKGNDKTEGKVIRRELFTLPGDYFSRNNIFRSIQQLANLKYFNVQELYKKGINYNPANDSTVNLVYTVEGKSSDYLNASVGYSGSFGFSGSIGITLSNFAIEHPFQMGGGQILNFNWQFGVGNYYRTFSFGYTQPWFLDTPTLVGFNVFDTRQRYIYDLRQTGGTIRVGRRLNWPDDFFNLEGRFRFQYNDVINGGNFYKEGLSRQYTLGMTLSRIDIDNPIFPSKGSKIMLSADLSGGPFLPGDVDYYKVLFNVDFYKRLFNTNRLTFYTGMKLGYINELTPGTEIQPFEFFYMGGNGLIIATTSLRGYDDRSVGPRNVNGNVIGGRVMSKYTVELRAAITLEPMPIYVLAFAEAGNVYYNLQQANVFNLKKSAGFGARILINPIGLIGFDLGYGFDRRSVDGKKPAWLFHFQFGRGF